MKNCRVIGHLRAIFWLIVVVSLTPLARAETRVNCEAGTCAALVEGEIGQSDVRAFRTAAKSPLALKGEIVVILDSLGGDVDAAIEIGRILRSFPTAYTIVSKDSKCYSSCIYVLAGGHRRIAHGQIGIHRAFSSSTKADEFERVNERFAELRRKIRDYLDFVNIPVVLFDAIQRVPANDMKILSAAEIRQFGLSEVDPVYQDVLDSKEAAKYGLGKLEYLSRKSEAQQVCRDLNPKLSRPGTIRAQVDALTGCIDGVIRGSQNAPR